MSRTTCVGTRQQFHLAWLLMAAMSVISARPAVADQEGFGLRAGVSADPDQFVLGLHYDTGPIVERLSFRPNAELGLGDNVTLVAFNFDLAYWIPLKGKPWQLYVGGGPSMNIYVFDDGDGPGRGGDDTDVEPGFNLLFGVAHTKGLFFEIKVGAIDSPDFKAMVGYSFGK
jgi:hypothetical protein